MATNYDKRSALETVNYISVDLGYKVSTLRKRKSKQSKQSVTYWMIEVKGASPLFMYSLKDLQLFIKGAERGLTEPT
jgi:hypothetical protein